MPIYEYECNQGHRWEELRDMRDYNNISICPIRTCQHMGEMVPSICAMRPDSLWAGHYIENYGYVTSSSKLSQIRKERHLVEVGDRADREAMKKTADEAAKARDEKFSKDTRKFIEDRFAGAGVLDSFGQIRPEATRKLSDEELLDPEAQKRKKETITIAND